MAKAKADQATEETPADEGAPDAEPLERAALADAPTADTDAEFPTPWHRDAFVADLERELAGAKSRVEELTELDAHPSAIASAQDMVDNATRELARVTKSEKKKAAA